MSTKKAAPDFSSLLAGPGEAIAPPQAVQRTAVVTQLPSAATPASAPEPAAAVVPPMEPPAVPATPSGPVTGEGVTPSAAQPITRRRRKSKPVERAERPSDAYVGLSFRVPDTFHDHFKQLALNSRVKLNELLDCMTDLWEQSTPAAREKALIRLEERKEREKGRA